MGLVLKKITIKSQEGKLLIRALSLKVSNGEIYSVMGPSGVGKSTLLDAIAGNLSDMFILSGTVELDGVDISFLPSERRRIGLLYQDAVLFPHLSVGQNLAFGLKIKNQNRFNSKKIVDKALWQAGLEGLYDRDPETLSGGQKSRAALMRTLLSEPRALLLDEPFSNLDLDTREEMRTFIFGLIAERNIPVLMVTHDADDALAARGPTHVLQPN